MRVYELARQLSLESRQLLEACERLGISVKSHASALVDEDVARLKNDLVAPPAEPAAAAAVAVALSPAERPERGNEALPVEEEDDIEQDADGNRDVPIPAKRKSGERPQSTNRQWGGLAENDPFFTFGSMPETWGSTRKQQSQPHQHRPKAYLECRNCGVKIEKKRAHGGKKVRCPFCPRWMSEVK